MRLLITGAAGAFGTSLLAHFRSNPDVEVIGTDRRASPRDEWRTCDLLDPAQVDRLLDESAPDGLIHLAGIISGGFASAYAANVDVTRHLLENILARGKQMRVVITGSAAAYGVVAPEDNPISESHALAPVSIYGLTKAWQTMLMHHMAAQGVHVCEARPFNLLGPGLSTALFAGRALDQIKSYKAGLVDRLRMGPLNALRDYIEFDLAARQVETILFHGTAGQVYNVGSGQPIRMRDLLVRMLRDQGVPGAPVEEDPLFSNRIGYDVPVIYADMRKTRALMEAS